MKVCDIVKKGLTVIGVLLIALIMFGIGFFSTYNSLMKYKGRIDDKKIIIDENLEKRAELVPQLISYVEKYLKDDTLDDLANAREELLKSNGIKEKAIENENLSDVIDELMDKVDEYPTLAKNSEFTKLKKELSYIDMRIDSTSKEYNELVSVYNAKLNDNQNKIMVRIFDFNELTYFEL